MERIAIVEITGTTADSASLEIITYTLNLCAHVLEIYRVLVTHISYSNLDHGTMLVVYVARNRAN